MNLLDDPWLPVVYGGGVVRRIRPAEMVAPGLVRSAWGRADFDGAACEFLIGLLHLVMQPADDDEWRERHGARPTVAALDEALSPYRDAFSLDGPGPRFMQDQGAAQGAEFSVAALLVDTPGGQSVGNNLDIFVKRDRVRGACPACAAMALFALQTYAPSGGAGHRTSLRGGGPLTTLVLGDDLWTTLWRNVVPAEAMTAPRRPADKPILPWLGGMPTSEDGTEVRPGNAPALQMFFGQPRRIWLDFEGAAPGCCDLCGARSERLLTAYATRPHGINYKGGWMHPLSPHTLEGTDASTALPRHGSPRGVDYRDWLSLVFGGENARNPKTASRPAQVVTLFRRRSMGAARLWAFGYDTDNMKARSWNDATMPIVVVAGDQTRFVTHLSRLVRAADEAAFHLRRQVKAALFADPGGVKAEFADLALDLAARTSVAFDRARDALADPRPDWNAAWKREAEAFLGALGRQALDIFDRTIAAVPVEGGKMKRPADARRSLRKALGIVRDQALGIADSGKRTASKKKETAQ